MKLSDVLPCWERCGLLENDLLLGPGQSLCTTSGWRRKRSSPQGFEIGVLLIRSCSLKTQSLPESLELQNQSEHLSTHGIFETPIEPQQPQSCPFRLSKAESKINRQQAASVIVVVSIRTNCQQVADHGLSWTCQCCNVAIAHLFDMWENDFAYLAIPGHGYRECSTIADLLILEVYTLWTMSKAESNHSSFTQHPTQPLQNSSCHSRSPNRMARLSVCQPHALWTLGTLGTSQERELGGDWGLDWKA